MRFLYNVLFLIFFVLSSPYYFLRMHRRGNWQRGFGQRFGLYDNKIKQAITNRQVIWVHAVSVGEMNVCIELIKALEPRLPNCKIVVSTTTTTGMEVLQKRLRKDITKIYYPIDRRKYVSRAMSVMHPEAVILLESEIWPNFIWRCRSLSKPVFLVNARMSDRSYPRYRMFKFLFGPLFNSFAGVGAQNEEYRTKLRDVGCRPDAIHVVGNLKFDTVHLEAALDVPALFAHIGVPPDALVLVAGSTHDGEEEVLADLFLRLRKNCPKLFLVLVPRHFERSREVGHELGQRGIKFLYRSEVSPDSKRPNTPPDCLLVNTTGELTSFYEYATIAFVGKSLMAKGGQNPIEPAAFGKPVVFGPNMQNFTDIARAFTSQDAALQVRNAKDLEDVLGKLLADPGRRAQLGEKARQVVKENQGAVNRTVEMIVNGLEGRDLYIVPAKTEVA